MIPKLNKIFSITARQVLSFPCLALIMPMNEYSEAYEAIGNQIIAEKFPDLTEVRIAWLASDKEKKNKTKTVFADCAKVSDRYDWCCPYDFIITVYQPNVEAFSAKQIQILLEHELMHCGIEGDKYSIIPHDIEDFLPIIEKYGLHWAETQNDFALLED